MSAESAVVSTESVQELAGKEVRRVTLWGLIINIFLVVIKLIAGIIGQSQAVIADAIHSLSDSITDVAVIVGSHYWCQPPDADHPFGHRRVEAIIGSFIGIALGVIGLLIGYSALTTLRDHHSEPPGLFPFVVAVISIISKEWLYRWTVSVGKRVKSPATIANAWHHRSDALSSIPVATAVAVSIYLPSWSFLDHFAAAGVAVFIIHAAWSIVRPLFKELIDTGASAHEINKIREQILGMEGVKSVHAIRTRFLGSEMILDLHLMVDGDLSVREGHNIAGRVKSNLFRLNDNIIDILIHVEPYDSQCSEEKIISETND